METTAQKIVFTSLLLHDRQSTEKGFDRTSNDRTSRCTVACNRVSALPACSSNPLFSFFGYTKTVNSILPETGTASPPSGAAVFHVHALTKEYDMGEVKVCALRGVDFELLPRELIVLLGPSGSGKSTLLNILGGLDTATSGQVSYLRQGPHAGHGAGAYGVPAVPCRLRVPVLQPHPEPHGARERGGGDRDRAQTRCGLKRPLPSSASRDRLDHFPAQLSGGEQQRDRHCARHLEEPRGPAVRRAHRRPRFTDRHRRARSPGAREPRARNRHGHHHPQRGHRGHGGPRRPSLQRPYRGSCAERGKKVAE